MSDERIKRIQRMREDGMTLEEIGSIEKVTKERIRQILSPVKYKTCKIHKIKYLVNCHYCYWKKLYSENLKKLPDSHIEIEGKRLSIQDRNLNLVIQRVLFIRKLRDKKKMKWREIAELLKRDRSSITNLYFKKI